MSSAALANGQAPSLAATHWAQLPVQRFLATFNWDNRAIELLPQEPFNQETFDRAPLAPLLDLRLTVSQFFGDINWLGTTAAANVNVMTAPVGTSPVADRQSALTLADFADSF